MSEPLFYVDRSDVLEGKAEAVRTGMLDLADFAEEHEPQLIAYHFYLDEAGTTMTTVAVHPDPASLDLHLRIGEQRFRAFATLVRLRTIDVYGDPGRTALDQLRQKAAYLGGAEVTVHTRQSGFSRLPRD
ncbi:MULTISPECIES: hypothetical protein [unclassified Streptomyces]|uniref:hypothetical protein n=1 Tax=unclassified Streptomyces TaxID=2593676 RepID=UPI003D716A1D